MGIEFGDDEHDDNCGDFYFLFFGQEINNEKIEMNKNNNLQQAFHPIFITIAQVVIIFAIHLPMLLAYS